MLRQFVPDTQNTNWPTTLDFSQEALPRLGGGVRSLKLKGVTEIKEATARGRILSVGLLWLGLHGSVKHVLQCSITGIVAVLAHHVHQLWCARPSCGKRKLQHFSHYCIASIENIGTSSCLVMMIPMKVVTVTALKAYLYLCSINSHGNWLVRIALCLPHG